MSRCEAYHTPKLDCKNTCPWPDRGLERTGPVLEPMKLTHLVKICGIRQANGIQILDALNAL
jgi:hypothetical protein